MRRDRFAVAKAGDRVLYFDQIPLTLVTPGMSKDDSTSAVQTYVRRWSRKELMALRAEENLTSEYKDEVTRQLDEMRNNLLIYQYQQQMIIQKMDTVVTESELQDYYVSNLEHVLADNQSGKGAVHQTARLPHRTSKK
ncbi:MAG: hypothetical protein MZV63_45250 [Marinilabiliales bacterium]|nr:hypothetical protein [Marinilabiliales bacterium]